MRIFLMWFLFASLMNDWAQAGVIPYNLQSAFEAAAPGLTMQDFSTANVANNSAAFVTGPLTSATSNLVFDPGDIAAGLTISAAGSKVVGGNQLYVAGVGTVGNTVKGIYTNASDSSMSLGFDGGVSAVGLKLLSFTNNRGPQQFDVTVLFSSPTAPQGYRVLFPDVGAGQFLGFIGSGGDKIEGVRFGTSADANIGVTFIEFGNPVSTVPEPSGLVIALIALSTGVVLSRGRQFLRRT